MKKLIAILVLGVSIGSFGIMMSEGEKPTGETDYSAINTYLRKTVYPQLYDLTDYSPKKSFSRCPSGFAHSIDEEKTQEEWVYGTMYYRQGCSSDEFAEFKMNVLTEKVFMKSEEQKTYASMESFVDGYENDRSEL